MARRCKPTRPYASAPHVSTPEHNTDSNLLSCMQRAPALGVPHAWPRCSASAASLPLGHTPRRADLGATTGSHTCATGCVHVACNKVCTHAVQDAKHAQGMPASPAKEAKGRQAHRRGGRRSTSILVLRCPPVPHRPQSGCCHSTGREAVALEWHASGSPGGTRGGCSTPPSGGADKHPIGGPHPL